MIYGSICSGIEAASVAWAPLGWEAAFLSEIDPFPRAVLRQRFPEVPLHGDFRTIEDGDYRPIDILVGGTPCQSFSVAGLRGGLGDHRGNLALEFLRLAQRLRPRWLVWENVPGVLSSHKGRDFGSILGGMGEIGYGFAYRVLDAQFFGVAQRRRRVFVVGYLGDWRRAAAVLFERESLSGNPPPRRQARQEVAGTVGANFDRGGTTQDAFAGSLLAFGGNNSSGPIDVATARTGHAGPMGRMDFRSETFITHAFDARQSGVVQYGDKTGPIDTNGSSTAILTLAVRGRPGVHDLDWRDDGTANAILTPSGGRAGIGVGAIAFTQNSRSEVQEIAGDGSIAGAVAARHGVQQQNYVAGQGIRRLTPRECERLQGFPDDWTLIPWRKGWAPDGPRYKAIGNSMVVPVMAHIGRRIALVEGLMRPLGQPLHSAGEPAELGLNRLHPGFHEGPEAV